MAHTTNKIPIRFIGAATGNARCYHIPRQTDQVTLAGTTYYVCNVIFSFPSALIEVELTTDDPCTPKVICEKLDAMKLVIDEILIEVKADIL